MVTVPPRGHQASNGAQFVALSPEQIYSGTDAGALDAGGRDGGRPGTGGGGARGGEEKRWRPTRLTPPDAWRGVA